MTASLSRPLSPAPDDPAPASPRRADWGDRLINIAIITPSAAMLGVGASLTPDPSGANTHTQLGLAPCGMLHFTGVPCPSCGMTTSVSLAAHGHIIDSFLTQPGGTLLALSAAMAVLVFGYALWRDLSPRPILRALARPTLVVLLFAFFLLSWGYKIAITLGSS